MAALYARFTAFEAAFNAQDAIDFTQNHAEIPVRGAFGILSPSPLRVPFESFGPIVGQAHDDGYPRPTASASSPSCPVGTTLPPAAIGDSPRPPPTSRPCFNTLCTASFSPAHVATSIIIFFITHLLLTHLLPHPERTQVIFLGLYLLGIFVLPDILGGKDRKGWNVKQMFTMWNL